MSVEELVKWIIGGLITIITGLLGFVWKSHANKIDKLEQNMGEVEKTLRDEIALHRAEDTQRFESLQQRFREDIKDVHKKIETGQLETTRRLDQILGKLG